MNRLYKRLVTIGMISFTALLGWIYCVAEYKDKPVYVICVSIALIVSVYALLASVISLRQKKDQKLKSDINEAVSRIIADFYEAQESANEVIEADKEPEKEPEIERICKALYVQLRKVNTTLSKDLITKEILNNATKVNLKYNHANSEKLLTAINELSDTLKLTPAPAPVIIEREPEPDMSNVTPRPSRNVPVAEETESVTANYNVEPEEDGVAGMVEDFLSSVADNNEEAAPVEEPNDTPNDVPSDEATAEAEALLAALEATSEAVEDTTPITEAAPEMPAAPEPVAEPGLEMLAGDSSQAAQSFFDEFGAGDKSAATDSISEDKSNILEFPTPTPEPEPVAEAEPTPEAEPAPEPTPAPAADPNKVLSPEEIAALFSSMQ